MSHRVINLPKKNSRGTIKTEVTGKTITLRNDDGYEIAKFDLSGPFNAVLVTLGSEIANALLSARNAGYRQAQRDIRNAMGIIDTGVEFRLGD